MPHKLRKIRKTRGSRTQGYGRIGQHRKTGSKGYRKAGRHKHLWSYVTTYAKDAFGKHGFTSRQSLKRNENVINVAKLEELASKLPAGEKGQTSIDLTGLGYAKLLGTGSIKRAIIVKVPSCSKSAAEKIQEAGGQVLTASQKTGE
ncbi:TPA: 50S ribosomal protein L15 [Candidatus Bathyarchaeota archaeon]|nr:50S ribosomal protein L15 [Candidatus Bathyarchaeota archaeon]